MKRLFCLALILVLLLGCFAGCKTDSKDGGSTDPVPDAPETTPTEPAPESTEPAPAAELSVLPEGAPAPVKTEDNARVFYEIFVGSFSDSNGDGIGDLRGIINRLDYLNDGDDASGKSLGIEGIWLSPILESNSYHKYDCNDYYAVDSDFGTMDDLKELVQECHKRNIKVIIDMVLNHSGRLNPWFSKFTTAHRDGNTEDPYYEFYTYYHEGETAPAGRRFAKLSGTDDYYECNFDTSMPELNYDSEAVRQAVLDVGRFYLELGVDGFRFDAAKYIYFGDNAKSAEFWVWYIGELQKINPEVYTVAEVWDGDNITDQYYPALNCFNFTTSQGEGLIAQAAGGTSAAKYAAYVESFVQRIRGLRADAMYVPFIANHDNDRAAGYLPTMNGRAYVAANLLILNSGSPFLYYGEELNMRGSRGSANTDANRRLAMVWGDGDTVKDPEGATYPAEQRCEYTAAEQLTMENSLYTHYKKVISLRKANPEIARGDYSAVTLNDSKAGGFIADYEGSRVLVLHNTTMNETVIDLSAQGLGEFTRLSGFAGLNGVTLDGSKLTIGAQTSVVLR